MSLIKKKFNMFIQENNNDDEMILYNYIVENYPIEY